MMNRILLALGYYNAIEPKESNYFIAVNTFFVCTMSEELYLNNCVTSTYICLYRQAAVGA